MLINKRAYSSDKAVDVTREFYGSSGTIMMHSRTMVEKKDFVSTGVLTYAEGDILEVELSEDKAFELADNVKLTFYSPGGVYTFQSTVVAKDHGALMVINPPQNRKLFGEKRESPRVDVSQSGKLTAIIKPNQPKQPLENHVELLVQNISSSGVGFKVLDHIHIEPWSMAQVHFDLGFDMPCVLEIVRSEPTEGGYFYGARYVDMAPDKANSLRAFVLKKQVENHFTVKRAELEKRLFE